MTLIIWKSVQKGPCSLLHSPDAWVFSILTLVAHRVGLTGILQNFQRARFLDPGFRVLVP